jgi:hypothetical protein
VEDQAMIEHYPNCNPSYPEKPKSEAPQSTTLVPFDDNSGEGALTCNDCGAFEIVKLEDYGVQPKEKRL